MFGNNNGLSEIFSQIADVAAVLAAEHDEIAQRQRDANVMLCELVQSMRILIDYIGIPDEMFQNPRPCKIKPLRQPDSPTG